jgi:hypothetical protein
MEEHKMTTQPTEPTPDLTDRIIAYEFDELTPTQTVELFSELVRTGLAFGLQGHYGRTAQALINGGYLAPDGTILATIEEVEVGEDYD